MSVKKKKRNKKKLNNKKRQLKIEKKKIKANKRKTKSSTNNETSLRELKLNSLQTKSVSILENVKDTIKNMEASYKEGDLAEAEEVGTKVREGLNAFNKSIIEAGKVADRMNLAPFGEKNSELRRMSTDAYHIEIEFWQKYLNLLVDLKDEEKLIEVLPAWNKFIDEYSWTYEYDSLMEMHNNFIGIFMSEESVNPELVSLLIQGYFFIRQKIFYDRFMNTEETRQALSYLDALYNFLQENTNLLSIAKSLINKYCYDISLEVFNSREINVVADFIIKLILTHELDDKTTEKFQNYLIDELAQMTYLISAPNSSDESYYEDADIEVTLELVQSVIDHYLDLVNESNEVSLLTMILDSVNILADRKEIQRAIHYLTKAYEIFENIKDDIPDNQFLNIILQINELLKKIGDYENVLKIARLIIKYLDKHEQVPEYYDFDFFTNINRIFAYTDLAVGSKGLNDLQEAQKSLDEIKKILDTDLDIEYEFPTEVDEAKAIVKGGMDSIKVNPVISSEFITDEYIENTRKFLNTVSEITDSDSTS